MARYPNCSFLLCWCQQFCTGTWMFIKTNQKTLILVDYFYNAQTTNTPHFLLHSSFQLPQHQPASHKFMAINQLEQLKVVLTDTCLLHRLISLKTVSSSSLTQRGSRRQKPPAYTAVKSTALIEANRYSLPIHEIKLKSEE